MASPRPRRPIVSHDEDTVSNRSSVASSSDTSNINSKTHHRNWSTRLGGFKLPLSPENGPAVTSPAVLPPPTSLFVSNVATFPLEPARFLDSRFDSHSYIQTTLQSTTEEGVRTFHRTLFQARDFAAKDLQQNVFKNYSEFVKISKEIAQLEADMFSLRGLLHDIRLIHDNSDPLVNVGHSANSTNIPKDELGSEQNRVSTTVEDLNSNVSRDTAEKHPLNELYKNVDGVAVLLGQLESTAHRCVLHSGPLTEMDGSSGRPKNSVLLYLLADVLLLATKRRKGLRIKYAAETAFSVRSLCAVDVRDPILSPDHCVFKIVDGSAPLFFRAENQHDKKTWLHLIHRQIEDYAAVTDCGIANTDASEVILEDGPTSSNVGSEPSSYSGKPNSFSKGGRRLSQATSFPEKQAEAMSPISPQSWTRHKSGLVNINPDGTNNASSIAAGESESLDELDVVIALQDFDLAIELVKELHGNPRLPDRVTRLTQALLRALSINPSNISLVHKLISLNSVSSARTTYLEGRTLQLRGAIRKLKFAGDLPAYVAELAHLTYIGVKATSEQYQTAFENFPWAFGFLAEWVSMHVNNLANAVLRQIGEDPSVSVFIPCLKACVLRLDDLKECGLDFLYVFWSTLGPQTEYVFDMLRDKSAEAICKSVLIDTLSSDSNNPSSSALALEAAIDKFLEESNYFLPQARFHSKILSCILVLVETYIKMSQRLRQERRLEKSQEESILLINYHWVAKTLIPALRQRLSKTCGIIARQFPQKSLIDRLDCAINSRDFSENHTVSDECNTSFEAQISDLNKKTYLSKENDKNGNKSTLFEVKKNASEEIGENKNFILVRLWRRLDDSALDAHTENLKPSPEMRSYVLWHYSNESEDTAPNLGKDGIAPILEQLYHEATPSKVCVGVVTQIVLDLHYMLRAVPEDVLTSTMRKSAHKISERALRAFLKTGGSAGLLHTSEWYDTRVATVMMDLEHAPVRAARKRT